MQNVPFASQQEQVNKFLQANRVLGAQMDQMQGTTRVIYDTINFNGRSSYSYFSELPSKQTTLLAGGPATNLNDNRFEPGEGMVIKEIGFANLLTNPAANIVDMGSGSFTLALIDIIVGNQRVVKDLPLFAGGKVAAINNINTFTNVGTENKRYNVMRLFTNIVIPPQIQFFVNLRAPWAPVAATANQSADALRCYLKGYGKLFNSRNNY
jgi:hypothetical protein